MAAKSIPVKAIINLAVGRQMHINYTFVKFMLYFYRGVSIRVIPSVLDRSEGSLGAEADWASKAIDRMVGHARIDVAEVT